MDNNDFFSTEFYSALFNKSTDAYFILNQDILIMCNEQASELFLMDNPQELIGKSVWDISPEIQFDMMSSREKGEMKIKEALKGHSPIFEWIHKKKDDTSFISEVKLMKIAWNDKQYILANVRDISKRKILEIELKQSKEKAEEATRLKSKFLSNMSHEIRTPLNAIIGFSELLCEPEVDDTDRKYFSSLIKNNGDLLLNLINDILDIAKIEADEVKIVKSRCPVNTLLKEIHLNYVKETQEREDFKIKLVSGSLNPNFAIDCDPYRLHQIIANLINNALKFTPKGEISFGYTIVENNTLKFFVKDTGIGMDHQKQANIFNRFAQAHDFLTQNFGGTGLGLDISKKLVELMGGQIWFDSEPNVGTNFYFTIPYETSNEVQKQEKATSNQEYDWSDKTILIAEDVEVNYNFLEYLLRKTKVKLIHAFDGEIAVDLFKKSIFGEKIDLILMDIQMPHKNGFQAMKEIKSLDATIPIIAQTAFAMDHEEQKCLKEGFDDFLSKPIKQDILLSKIGKRFSN